MRGRNLLGTLGVVLPSTLASAAGREAVAAAEMLQRPNKQLASP